MSPATSDTRMLTDLDSSGAFVPFLYEGLPDIPPDMTLDEYRRARYTGRPPTRRGLARLAVRLRPRAA